MAATQKLAGDASRDPRSWPARLRAFASPRAERWLLAGLLAWALGVRLWFASVRLDPGRFWDESFILDNVFSFLSEGSLRPVHLYYPGLGNLLHSLLLAASRLTARWMGLGGEAILRGDSFTPAAYLIARGFQACVGVLTLYWTYRIGRRLVSPHVGLLAALALAAVPMHVRQSAVIKPDILMLLGVLIATEATVSALDRGRLGDFVGAGAAVGLATSGKYNGVAAALPLALFGLAQAPRRPAVLARLAAAGLAAVLVFVALNPFFFSMLGKFEKNFHGTLERYETHPGADEERSRFAALVAVPGEMLGSQFHGVVTGSMGFAGLLGVLVYAWRRRANSLALLAVFPLAYAATYAAVTSYPKANNYLPLAPYLALGAAALVVEMLRRAGGTRPVLLVAVAIWVGWLLWRPMQYVYLETVPTTLEVAGLELKPQCRPASAWCVLVQIGVEDGAVRLEDEDGRAMVREAAAPEAVAATALDLADVEVYGGAARSNSTAAARLAGASRVLRVEPRPFRASGEPLTMALHPWTLLGEPIELATAAVGNEWVAQPSQPIVPPAVVSVEVLLAPDVEPPPTIAVAGRSLELFVGGRRGRRWVTERVRLDGPLAAVRMARTDPEARPPSVRLARWWPP